MKTKTDIEIKKIRKQLKVHTLNEDKKSQLRKTLSELKKNAKIKNEV